MNWFYVILIMIMLGTIFILLTTISSLNSVTETFAILIITIGLAIGSILMVFVALDSNEENVKETKYEDIELIEYNDGKATYITEDKEYVTEEMDKVYIDDETYIITENGYRYLYAPLEIVKGE